MICLHLNVSSYDGHCYRCGKIIEEVVEILEKKEGNDGASTASGGSPPGAPLSKTMPEGDILYREGG